jgi:DNA-binding response OmpR family regulator
LIGNGYRARCVSDVRGAHESLAEITPAVVLLCWDIDAETAEKVRIINSVPRGSALIVTSRTITARMAAKEHGASFLSKPFGIEDFVEAVAAGAQRRRN